MKAPSSDNDIEPLVTATMDLIGEGAQSQRGGEVLEEGAISIIMDILARIQKEDGRLGAQQDWSDEMCPPDPCVSDPLRPLKYADVSSA